MGDLASWSSLHGTQGHTVSVGENNTGRMYGEALTVGPTCAGSTAMQYALLVLCLILPHRGSVIRLTSHARQHNLSSDSSS